MSILPNTCINTSYIEAFSRNRNQKNFFEVDNLRWRSVGFIGVSPGAFAGSSSPTSKKIEMWGHPFQQPGFFPAGMRDDESGFPPGFEQLFPGGRRPQYDQFGRPIVPAQQRRSSHEDPRRSMQHAEHARQSAEQQRAQGRRSFEEQRSKPPSPPPQRAPPTHEQPQAAKPAKKSYADTLKDTLTPEELVEKRAQSATLLQKNLNQLSQNRATMDIVSKLSKLAKMERAFKEEVKRHESSVFQIPLTFEDNYKRVIPNRFNRPFLQYEDALQKMLLALDEVSTGGHELVRDRRRALVAQVQAALDRVDQRREDEKAARKAEVQSGLPGPELPSRSPSRSPPPQSQAAPSAHADKLQAPPRSKVETIPIEVENVEIKPPVSQPAATVHNVDKSAHEHQDEKKKKNRRRKSKSRQMHRTHSAEQASESDGSDSPQPSPAPAVHTPPRRPAEAAHEAAAHVAQQERPHHAPQQPQHAQRAQQMHSQQHPQQHSQQHPQQHPQQRQQEARRSHEEPRTVRMHPQYGPYIVNDDGEPVLVELRQLPDGRQVLLYAF